MELESVRGELPNYDISVMDGLSICITSDKNIGNFHTNIYSGTTIVDIEFDINTLRDVHDTYDKLVKFLHMNGFEEKNKINITVKI